MKNNYTGLFWGAFHIIFLLFVSSYGLIFNKSWVDDIFILYFVLLVLSWTLLKGECIISYIYNLYKNPNYTAGEDLNAGDILEFFGNKTIYLIFSVFIGILTVISNIILLLRNGYPTYIVYSSALLFLLYNAMLKTVQSPSSSSVFFIVNEFVKYSFLLILLFVIHKIYIKYKK